MKITLKALPKFYKTSPNVVKAFDKMRFEILDKLEEDPIKREPLIELARKELDWEPKVSLSDRLDITRNYFQEMLLK